MEKLQEAQKKAIENHNVSIEAVRVAKENADKAEETDQVKADKAVEVAEKKFTTTFNKLTKANEAIDNPKPAKKTSNSKLSKVKLIKGFGSNKPGATVPVTEVTNFKSKRNYINVLY